MAKMVRIKAHGGIFDNRRVVLTRNQIENGLGTFVLDTELNWFEDFEVRAIYRMVGGKLTFDCYSRVSKK